MRSIINELWHGNIIPQEDSRTNTKAMKELLGYMSRHHEDLEKSYTEEQKRSSKSFTIVGASMQAYQKQLSLSMLSSSGCRLPSKH